jgi:hypothetical protein
MIVGGENLLTHHLIHLSYRWTGDVSHIWKKFKSNEKFYLNKYNKGSDEFYFKEIEYKTYDKICPSIKDYIYEKPKDYSILL